ncbi:DoxX family protein [Sphingomonadaceae bacterium OTU29THOMA1]|nr:DoxX family protein [Sphingomonadaceae bacterium OTU29THOMA1]
MQSQPYRIKVWAGRLISASVALIMVLDAAVNLLSPQSIAEEQAKVGFAPGSSTALGIIMLICAAAYVIPRTAVIGAILITAFFGGAICAHFRIGETAAPPQLLAIVVAALAWFGLWLRNGVIRQAISLGTVADDRPYQAAL